MKNVYWFILALLVIGGVVYFASQQTANQQVQNPAVTNVPEGQGGAGVTVPVNNIKELTVEANPFYFMVTEVDGRPLGDRDEDDRNIDIRVKKGDTVRLTFKNMEGFHDFVIDEFTNARTNQLQAGQEQTIEFVADKVGTYKYYCSVGNHRQMGMEGNFIVE